MKRIEYIVGPELFESFTDEFAEKLVLNVEDDAAAAIEKNFERLCTDHPRASVIVRLAGGKLILRLEYFVGLVVTDIDEELAN